MALDGGFRDAVLDARPLSGSRRWPRRSRHPKRDAIGVHAGLDLLAVRHATLSDDLAQRLGVEVGLLGLGVDVPLGRQQRLCFSSKRSMRPRWISACRRSWRDLRLLKILVQLVLRASEIASCSRASFRASAISAAVMRASHAPWRCRCQHWRCWNADPQACLRQTRRGDLARRSGRGRPSKKAVTRQ